MYVIRQTKFEAVTFIGQKYYGRCVVQASFAHSIIIDVKCILIIIIYV